MLPAAVLAATTEFAPAPGASTATPVWAASLGEEAITVGCLLPLWSPGWSFDDGPSNPGKPPNQKVTQDSSTPTEQDAHQQQEAQPTELVLVRKDHKGFGSPAMPQCFN
jgi:hypothetical protein